MRRCWSFAVCAGCTLLVGPLVHVRAAGATGPDIKADVRPSLVDHAGMVVTAKDRECWSFRPVADPPVPTIRNPKSEIRNEIDAFIQARLEKEGLTPSPPADKRTLIRRI